jgi:hypothetical protein
VCICIFYWLVLYPSGKLVATAGSMEFTINYKLRINGAVTWLLKHCLLCENSLMNEQVITRQRPTTTIEELLGVVFSMWSRKGINVVGCHCLVTTSDAKDNSVFVAVICRMCRLVRMLLLFVVMNYKGSVNPVTNPNPISSHLHVTLFSKWWINKSNMSTIKIYKI